jgi:hypothetical protein
VKSEIFTANIMATTPKRKQRNSSNKKPKNGQKRKQPRARAPRMEIAPVAVGLPNSFSSSSRQRSVRMSGYDRLTHIEDASAFTFGSVVFDQVLNTSVLPRLQTASRAFQRVHYHSITVCVDTMAPTSVSGGYVAAMVRDASEVLPDDPQAFITAQDNSIAAKWWQEGMTRETRFPDLFYTSPGDDPRLYTPARFILVCNGKANQTTPITINVKWDVTLSEPSLELAGVEETLTSAIPIGMATDGEFRDWSTTPHPVAAFATVFPGATATVYQGLSNGEYVLDSGVWRYTSVTNGTNQEVMPVRYYTLKSGNLIGMVASVASGNPVLVNFGDPVEGSVGGLLPHDVALAPWFFTGKNFTAVTSLKASATTVDFLMRR